MTHSAKKPRCKYCGCTETPIVVRGHVECPKCHSVIESCCEGGFTLIELLAAVSIIAILVALQLPMLAKVKFEAQRAECMNYKRQLKIFYYTTDFEDGSPPYTIRPLMKASRLGGKCYDCHASAP